MIRFLLLQNRAGKTRLAKYYVPVGDAEKRKLEYDVHRLIVTRDPKHTNFAEFKTYKIVYRRYAGLFFSVGIDVSDNELAALEAIHLFVEILDHYFSNVCELDLVFNFHKVRPPVSYNLQNLGIGAYWTLYPLCMQQCCGALSAVTTGSSSSR
eukprot:GHRR01009383.1.p2 GENE.GHRR01009383.1~~GHRR01009383.1.p2  ORF type:complete len:153 (+),score=34.20 GHRR01009383.1:230-688(+)